MRNPTRAAAATVALVLAACATPKLHPYELDEADVGAPGVETVLLLPLNLLVALPPELDGATGRVTGQIRSHLEACGVRVASLGLAEARSLWNEGAGPAGEGDAGRDVPRYVRQLRAGRPFDALVVPSLVYRDARIRALGAHAEWDGVQREIHKAGNVHMQGSFYVEPELRGKMPGVSLHVAVYDPTGALVFDSLGGLDLVHEVEYGTAYRQDLNNRFPVSTYEWRLRRKRLRDEDALREGVAMAFTPWLDAPAAESPESAAP